MVQLAQRVMVVVMAGYLGLVLVNIIIGLLMKFWLLILLVVVVVGIGGWVIRKQAQRSQTFRPF